MIVRFIFLLAFLFAVRNAQACSCETIKGLKESDVVFRGKVVSVRQIDSTLEYEILFRVSKRVKKTKAKMIKVTVPCLLVACCGVEFRVEDCYEVYAYIANRGKLMTSNCTATKKLK